MSSSIDKVIIHYSPTDNLVYRNNENKQLQKIMFQIASFYGKANQALNINPTQQALLRKDPPVVRSQHTFHDDFLFWYVMTRPSPGFNGLGSVKPSVGGSASGAGGCRCDKDSCLIALVIIVLAFALIAFIASAYKTCKEASLTHQNRTIRNDILKLHKEFNTINSEGQADIPSLKNALKDIESHLLKQSCYHGVNAFFGSLGTGGLGLLIVSLVGVLLHLGHISHELPIEMLALSGAAALTLAIIVLSFNHGLKPRVNKEKYEKSWNKILERAALPAQALIHVETLYKKWQEEPGKKFYTSYRSQNNCKHCYWSIEAEAEHSGQKGILILFQQCENLLDLKNEGYEFCFPRL